jgi:hypothetical protein
MTIRFATLADIPLVYNLVTRFIDKSPYNHLSKDPTKLYKEIQRVLSLPKEEFITLLSEKSILAMGITELPLSKTRIAQEVVWYSEGPSKDFVLMFQAAEFWAKKLGVNGIQFSSLSSSPPSVDRFYEKNGYNLTEKAFLKWQH